MAHWPNSSRPALILPVLMLRKRLIVTRVQAQSTGGMRPDASENSQISPSTIVRAARAAGSHPHLASVLLQGRKSANIHASSGVIWGMSGLHQFSGLEPAAA